MSKISPKAFGGDEGNEKLRRRGRKPLSSFYQHPEDAPTLHLLPSDWEEIEAGYRAPLSDALRENILGIVNDYFWFLPCDTAKPRADDAIAYLRKVVKAAAPDKTILKLPRKPAHAAARDVLLEYYLFDEEVPEKTVVADDFKDEPDQVRRAAENMARDIEQQDTAPPTAKPSEWDNMVVELMRALRDAKLPYTVNKRGTSKGASPIISLLVGLQEHFPPEFRCHVSRDGEADEATIAAAASKAWTDFQKSSVGRRDARKRASAVQKKEVGRAERLNKAFKYLAFHKARQRSAPACGTRTPKTTS
jgi:hypothetical protein